jgi:hypothetical protein
MTGIDGLSRLVLANVKVPSEQAERIIPFLEKIKSDYGAPIACVHDMGTGICKAVATVFAGTRDFICHFHFLRDAGKDLLEPAYRPLLAFAERIWTFLDWLPRLLESLPGQNAVGNRLFLHLSRKILAVAGDPAFEQTVEELRWRGKIFERPAEP